jgi:uncharacterized membrane protein YcjF (UPF0283 family)
MWSFSWSETTQKKEAMQKARKSLKENLKYSCRAIPCPECAHVQAHMVSTAQHEFAFWGYIAAGAMVGLAIVGWGVAKIAQARSSFETPCLVLLGAGVIVGIASYVIAILHDPNKVSRAKRLAVADNQCQSREEFEAKFNKNIAKEFDREFKRLAKTHNRGEVAEFVVPFWADKDQVYEEVKRKVRLPIDEDIRIPRASDMRTGEEFTIKRTVEDVPVTFVCRLNVYTETIEKK